MTRNGFVSLGLAWCLASFLAGSAAGQPVERAIGKKLVDGQAYVTLVRLSYQANRADNGRLLIAFEENGMEGIPIYESRDEGESWQLVTHATDAQHGDHAKCNLHWQPHLTEMPRTVAI